MQTYLARALARCSSSSFAFAGIGADTTGGGMVALAPPFLDRLVVLPSMPSSKRLAPDLVGAGGEGSLPEAGNGAAAGAVAEAAAALAEAAAAVGGAHEI